MFTADEGYYFGLGAFETIAVEEGKPVFLEEHYQRLLQALQFFELQVDFEKIQQKVQEALGEEPVKIGRKVLKITVSQKNIVVSTRENTYREEDYRQGFTAAYAKIRRNETSPLTYHKTLNYGDCILEKRRAKAQGIQEPVFLNTTGQGRRHDLSVFDEKHIGDSPCPVVCCRGFCGSICIRTTKSMSG